MAKNRIKQQKSMSLSLTSETAVEYTIYEPASYSIQYRIFEKNTSVHNVAANIRRLSVFDILWKQKKGFEKFREEYLPLSAYKFTQASSPQEFSKYYDAVICGSDQIWNVTAKDCDLIFFLPGKQEQMEAMRSPMTSLNSFSISLRMINTT